jgi:AcrR family transcriptional regulator
LSLPSDGREGGDWELPHGPHKLSREVVSERQRKRLLAGATQAVAKHGYAELTVEQILREAGISRTTFYEHFKNRRECVLAAHEAAFEKLTGAVDRACEGRLGWPDRLAAGIGIAVDYATVAPEDARLLVPEAMGADPLLARRALVSTDRLVDRLREGREHSAEAAALPELTERALIGAATSVIGACLVSGQAERLPALKPQLVELMLLPYVGSEEARRMARSRT